MYRLIAFSALVIAVVGCNSTPEPKGDPVAVQGVVLKPDGKPASDVTINFLPTTSKQNQVGFALKNDGKFDIKLNPGKFRYVFEGKAIESIPQKYRSAREENEVEIPPTGTNSLTIKLEN